jgi:hypothetical protein
MTDIALNPIETLHLVALDRPQLEAAHAKMIAWAKARIEKVDVDLQVEEGARDAAIEHKFVAAPFDRRIKALARSRTFYEKILAAVEAGFVIVPNFAMNVFAIRTKAAKPRSATSTWEASASSSPRSICRRVRASIGIRFPSCISTAKPATTGRAARRPSSSTIPKSSGMTWNSRSRSPAPS